MSPQRGFEQRVTEKLNWIRSRRKALLENRKQAGIMIFLTVIVRNRGILIVPKHHYLQASANRV